MVSSHAVPRSALVTTLLLALLTASRAREAEPGRSSATPGAINLPAVPVHAPVPFSPREAVMVSKPPTVGVAMTIDERGRVSKVEVTDISPSGPKDAVFRATAISALSKWRFAPAIADGRPVETVITMKIQFQHPGEKPPNPYGREAVDIPVPEQDDSYALEFERQLSTMPKEQFAQVRGELLASAESGIDQASRRQLDVGEFEIVTDGSLPDLPKLVAGDLAAVTAALGKVFGAGLSLQPPSGKTYVYVFAKKASFDRLARALMQSGEAAGVYSSVGLLAFHLEMPTNEDLLHTLVHETTHAFVQRALCHPGGSLPRWLGEGLADYFANSEIEGGVLVPGSHRASTSYHAPGEVVRGRSRAARTADDVRAAMKAGTALPLAKLRSATSSEFYGGEHAIYYGESWLLVHFLRHGQPGWAEHEFPRFILSAVEGFPADDLIRDVYGLDDEALEAAFKVYVKSF